jgi:DNA-binding PadR family transcriptional regulator
MKKPPKRSPIALAALAMLYEAPMHPYRMQRLIKERGKDEVINVTQRASLYQTIDRLERDGLIAAKPQAVQDDNRPERTVYEITQSGRAITLEWMRQILSRPAQEFPDFPAAISFLPLLTPEDALQQLELRQIAIEAEIKRIDDGRERAAAVPRLFLLEMEYLRAMHATELNWVISLIADLRSQAITWSEPWLRQIAAQFAGQFGDTQIGDTNE